MANRISEQDLYSVRRLINQYLGGQRTVELSGAYGGWKFLCADSGTDLLGTGYVSKRELYEAAHVWARGFRVASELCARGELWRLSGPVTTSGEEA